VVLLDLKDLVAPGWLPLLLTGVLLLVCYLLYLSMRRHMRKIDVPVDPRAVQSSPFAGPGE